MYVLRYILIYVINSNTDYLPFIKFLIIDNKVLCIERMICFFLTSEPGLI